MKYRSWLIVPGNSEKRLGNCAGSGGDVVIVDLEDTVPVELKRLARGNAAEWLANNRGNALENPNMGRWVRINPMSTPIWREDLMAIMPSAPDGILLPKADGPDAVRQLAAEIYEIEERCGVPANSTQIIPLVGETPKSAVTIPDYLDSSHQRISGLSWGAHDLAAAISGTASHGASRGFGDIFNFVRAQTLLTAHANGFMAVETSYADFEDLEGLAAAAHFARSDGFTGMLAIHHEQVETINRAFTPSEDEVRQARDIVAAFDASPGIGSLEFNGRMIDKPHLKRARRLLGIASEASEFGASEQTAILRPA